MRRVVSFAALVVVIMLPTPALIAAPRFSPGSPGAGDPYFPLDGNGGYDVTHYRLNITYNPESDRLTGVARIRAEATKNLSRFNFDFDGLRVRSIRVEGRSAGWERRGGELIVTPDRGLRRGSSFLVVVSYSGIPKPIRDLFGVSGFMRTNDGVIVAGQPHVASTWFPANDHPIDKASYTFSITVPEGLEAVANGVLVDTRTEGGWTTWSWDAQEPMATYLAAMAIGEFDLRAYEAGAVSYWDAIDPVLLEPVATPRSGDQFAISQAADFGYKRLSRMIEVPAEGGQLSFWVNRQTEPGYDFFFVEARTAGQDDWTTLRDQRGHTERYPPCPYLIEDHPFLEHYVTPLPDEPSCETTGTTGRWWAASGSSNGWERWVIDLSRWAGGSVEVSMTVASDFLIPMFGVFVDDVVVSTGVGTTSFEVDGDELDGWMVPGPPVGSSGNANDWIAGTEADTPPNFGQVAEGAMQRQDEFLAFMADTFGPYPFSASGGVVDDKEFYFALEIQTRPFYSKYFFTDPASADTVMVHELAHQWFGDSVAVRTWRNIWLNEGFATYAEWLWSEHDGLATAQELFEESYGAFPARNSFWKLKIGNPGPDALFDFAVYVRGAMTLHMLRLTIGDEAFFELVGQWYTTQAGGHGRTSKFIALAEEVSGQQLDAFFETWLFTESRPDISPSLRQVGESGQLRSSVAAVLQRLRSVGA